MKYLWIVITVLVCFYFSGTSGFFSKATKPPLRLQNVTRDLHSAMNQTVNHAGHAVQKLKQGARSLFGRFLGNQGGGTGTTNGGSFTTTTTTNRTVSQERPISYSNNGSIKSHNFQQSSSWTSQGNSQPSSSRVEDIGDGMIKASSSSKSVKTINSANSNNNRTANGATGNGKLFATKTSFSQQLHSPSPNSTTITKSVSRSSSPSKMMISTTSGDPTGKSSLHRNITGYQFHTSSHVSRTTSSRKGSFNRSTHLTADNQDSDSLNDLESQIISDSNNNSFTHSDTSTSSGSSKIKNLNHSNSFQTSNQENSQRTDLSNNNILVSVEEDVVVTEKPYLTGENRDSFNHYGGNNSSSRSHVGQTVNTNNGVAGVTLGVIVSSATNIHDNNHSTFEPFSEFDTENITDISISDSENKPFSPTSAKLLHSQLLQEQTTISVHLRQNSTESKLMTKNSSEDDKEINSGINSASGSNSTLLTNSETNQDLKESESEELESSEDSEFTQLQSNQSTTQSSPTLQLYSNSTVKRGDNNEYIDTSVLDSEKLVSTSSHKFMENGAEFATNGSEADQSDFKKSEFIDGSRQTQINNNFESSKSVALQPSFSSSAVSAEELVELIGFSQTTEVNLELIEKLEDGMIKASSSSRSEKAINSANSNNNRNENGATGNGKTSASKTSLSQQLHSPSPNRTTITNSESESSDRSKTVISTTSGDTKGQSSLTRNTTGYQFHIPTHATAHSSNVHSYVSRITSSRKGSFNRSTHTKADNQDSDPLSDLESQIISDSNNNSFIPTDSSISFGSGKIKNSNHSNSFQTSNQENSQRTDSSNNNILVSVEEDVVVTEKPYLTGENRDRSNHYGRNDSRSHSHVGQTVNTNNGVAGVTLGVIVSSATNIHDNNHSTFEPFSEFDTENITDISISDSENKPFSPTSAKLPHSQSLQEQMTISVHLSKNSTESKLMTKNSSEDEKEANSGINSASGSNSTLLTNSVTNQDLKESESDELESSEVTQLQSNQSTKQSSPTLQLYSNSTVKQGDNNEYIDTSVLDSEKLVSTSSHKFMENGAEFATNGSEADHSNFKKSAFIDGSRQIQISNNFESSKSVALQPSFSSPAVNAEEFVELIGFSQTTEVNLELTEKLNTVLVTLEDQEAITVSTNSGSTPIVTDSAPSDFNVIPSTLDPTPVTSKKGSKESIWTKFVETKGTSKPHSKVSSEELTESFESVGIIGTALDRLELGTNKGSSRSTSQQYISVESESAEEIQNSHIFQGEIKTIQTNNPNPTGTSNGKVNGTEIQTVEVVQQTKTNSIKTTPGGRDTTGHSEINNTVQSSARDTEMGSNTFHLKGTAKGQENSVIKESEDSNHYITVQDNHRKSEHATNKKTNLSSTHSEEVNGLTANHFSSNSKNQSGKILSETNYTTTDFTNNHLNKIYIFLADLKQQTPLIIFGCIISCIILVALFYFAFRILRRLKERNIYPIYPNQNPEALLPHEQQQMQKLLQKQTLQEEKVLQQRLLLQKLVDQPNKWESGNVELQVMKNHNSQENLKLSKSQCEIQQQPTQEKKLNNESSLEVKKESKIYIQTDNYTNELHCHGKLENKLLQLGDQRQILSEHQRRQEIEAQNFLQKEIDERHSLHKINVETQKLSNELDQQILQQSELEANLRTHQIESLQQQRIEKHSSQQKVLNDQVTHNPDNERQKLQQQKSVHQKQLLKIESQIIEQKNIDVSPSEQKQQEARKLKQHELLHQNYNLQNLETQTLQQNESKCPKLPQEDFEVQKLQQQEFERQKQQQEEFEHQKLQKQEFELQKQQQEEFEHQKLQKQEFELQKQQQHEFERQKLIQQKLESQKLQQQEFERQKLQQQEFEHQKLQQQEFECQKLKQQKLENQKLQQDLQRRKLQQIESERQKLQQRELEQQKLKNVEFERQRVYQEFERQKLDHQKLQQFQRQNIQPEIETSTKLQQQLESQKLQQQGRERQRLQEQKLESHTLEKETEQILPQSELDQASLNSPKIVKQTIFQQMRIKGHTEEKQTTENHDVNLKLTRQEKIQEMKQQFLNIIPESSHTQTTTFVTGNGHAYNNTQTHTTNNQFTNESQNETVISTHLKQEKLVHQEQQTKRKIVTKTTTTHCQTCSRQLGSAGVYRVDYTEDAEEDELPSETEEYMENYFKFSDQ